VVNDQIIGVYTTIKALKILATAAKNLAGNTGIYYLYMAIWKGRLQGRL
jgi:hypothetical protein